MFSIFFCFPLSLGAIPAIEPLKPLAPFIGTWKGSGTLETGEKSKWAETLDVFWVFTDKETYLRVKFSESPFFSEWEIRAVDKKFHLTAKPAKGSSYTYLGELKEKQLILERKIETDRFERLVINLLHDNRMTYRIEEQKRAGALFVKKIVVGITKEGVPFVDIGRAERECIVSGGLGTMTVTYEGKTYYVCCSGCRDEFKRDPVFYIKEWEKKNPPK